MATTVAVDPQAGIEMDAPLLDAGDLSPGPNSAPDLKSRFFRRQFSLGSNPWVKVATVGSAAGFVFMIVGMFTLGIMDSFDQETVKTSSPTEPDADFEDPMVEGTPQPELDERGQLLTELALGEQGQEIAEAMEEKADVEPAIAKVPQKQVAPAPPPRVISTSALPPPRPAVQPTHRPPVRAVTPARSAAQTPSHQQVDPTEQWMTLAHLGSYRRGPAQSSTPGELAPPVSPPEILENPQFSAPTQATVRVANSATNSPVRLASVTHHPPAINHAEEAVILADHPIELAPSYPQTLPTGTTASAQLTTPLIWVGIEETPSTRFVIQLIDPLLTPDEQIGIPAKTQLVAEVQSVHQNGLAQLSVVSLLQGGQEFPLPEHAISIRGANGTPLMAQKYGDAGSDILGMDLRMAAFAGLAKMGELINRPRTTSSVITPSGGSTFTQESNSPDILAGALEGAFGVLADQVSARNQRALDEMLSRAEVWYLAQGTQVEVFINQTLEL
ncbi:MAG: hypothetical protein F6K19_49055 [Cyanothece sp. SIO1E1]|nr:hypothetical protein [Cyanothece sp. SIO1E1]